MTEIISYAEFVSDQKKKNAIETEGYLRNLLEKAGWSLSRACSMSGASVSTLRSAVVASSIYGDYAQRSPGRGPARPPGCADED